MSHPSKLFLITILCSTTLLASAQKKPKEYNPFESISKKGRIVAAYGGRFVEVFDYDSVQRIGSVMIHIYKKTIVGLLNADSTFSKVSDNSSASRWYSIDPLTSKYPQWSPYVFAADNPIRYNDPDGREFVDQKGKHVTITFNKNGTLKFSKNANADLVKLVTGMVKTGVGLKMVHTMNDSKTQISMKIDHETILKKADGTITAGDTKPTISQKTINGQPVGEKYLSKAEIIIYEAGIKKIADDNDGKMNISGTQINTAVTPVDDIMASYGVHEGTHATDRKSSFSLNPGGDAEKTPYENQLLHLKQLEEKQKQ